MHVDKLLPYQDDFEEELESGLHGEESDGRPVAETWLHGEEHGSMVKNQMGDGLLKQKPQTTRPLSSHLKLE